MEWKEVTLGEITNLVIDYRGKTPLKLGSSWSDSGYRALSAKNIKTGQIVAEDSIRFVDEELYRKWMKDEVNRGDILITSEAPFGQIYYWDSDEKIVLSQRLFDVRLNDEVCHKYVYYFMTSHRYQKDLEGRATGTTVTGLRQPELLKSTILLPPLSAQRSIASILSSLDRKIELNNKINADLEEMAQAIFKNWFVDFEPFKGGKFVDSELGMIPEGWKVISLNEILDNVSGYSYKGSELQSSNIAMATIKNFERKGGFKTEGYKEIVISKKIKETQFVNMFDVLVAHTDLTQNAEIVGNPAIVLSKGGYEKLIMSMDLTKVISTIDGVTNGLLYCILSTSRFKEHALGYVNGTTVLHMSKKAVPEYTCAFPKDINQIRDLCITLDSIYKRMAVTYDENSRLSTLRDTLLPRLMSGELEVPE